MSYLSVQFVPCARFGAARAATKRLLSCVARGEPVTWFHHAEASAVVQAVCKVR